MTRELIGFIALLIVPAMALIAFTAVRRRRRAQESVIEPLPEFKVGEALPDSLYVSTVFTSSPLERVWARGLGPRGRAQVSISESGLGIARTGEASFTIPSASIQRIGTSTATIDKAVERDGLLSISWTHSGIDLITQLRFSSAASHQKALDTITTKLGVRFE